MYRFYASPTTLDEALALKAEHRAAARFMAGGTDLLLEIERGGHRDENGQTIGVIDLTRVPGMAEIEVTAETLHLGALVTHNQCVRHATIVADAFALARACWEVGAPQIRNRATVAGNIITASPANDTIVPLLALDATVTLASAARGTRTVSLADFMTGFRSVDLADDELLVRINIPRPVAGSRGSFVKLGLRRAQAISVVSVAAVLQREGEVVTDARLALGAVAPLVVRAPDAEAYLRGRELTEEIIVQAAELAVNAASPIDDLRGSAGYRRDMVRSLTARLLRTLAAGRERAGWPAAPITLRGKTDGRWPVQGGAGTTAIATTAIATTEYTTIALINGVPTALQGGMTLLDSLRLAGLTGVKEGCAEGECGACTVSLDGMAVMACLVPAERAAGSEVVTVEGLSNADGLHPVQDALVACGGVQCGYCTPGFVMSAAKLLEECPLPGETETKEALTGNLCRCTGYRKIVDAVIAAGTMPTRG